MTKVYGAKKDANHTEIVGAIKKLRIPFIDLSALGYGVPDLVVEIRGKLELWEIKNKKTGYGRRGLSKNQKAWAAKWAGNPVVVIMCVDDVLIRAGVVIGAVRG